MTTNFKNNKSLCIFPWIENYQGSRYERKYCCISDDLKGLEKTTEEEQDPLVLETQKAINRLESGF